MRLNWGVHVLEAVERKVDRKENHMLCSYAKMAMLFERVYVFNSQLLHC